MRKQNFGIPKLTHKFNAVKSECDGIKFPSKKERNRYLQLKKMQETGEVIFFLMQVPFRLPAGIKYVCDFQIFWSDGSVTFEDVKGIKTPIYTMKKKQVESEYPIEIIEV